jgi:DNA repair exonuclease SbcCD nuclease subunit
MKILFTADWHIKLGQKNVPVDWSLNRYRQFFQQVYSIEPKVDVHIIGGDIFDRMPLMEELQLYFEFISGVSVDTIIYAGNHESTKKGKTFLSNLKDVTNRINSKVTIVDYIHSTKDFTIVPYEFIKAKNVWDSLDPDVPLFTHVRGEIPPHVKPEIDLELLSKFNIVFAGDLHSHSNTQLNIVYPGSPMTTSFHRNEVSTGYIISDGAEWTWHEFNLPQLIRKTVTDPTDMVKTDFHHTIYELEGDVVDLSKIKSTELLDKKLVKRSSDAALLLTKDMSKQEELIEYLSYVLEIPEEKIPGLIGVYNDYAKNT